MVNKELILKCKDIQHSFGSNKVLNSLNLELVKGEIKAIIGASGCGKTTLLKNINLLIPPQKGELQLSKQVYFNNGEIIYEPYELCRSIGLVFQDFNLFPNLTCLNNITLALIKNLGFTKENATETSLRIAEKLHIQDVLKKYPGDLSGGQAQRLSIARAIVLKPKILLLDEITSALDPNTTQNVIDAIKDVKLLLPELSIIIVTHHIQFAERFADNIAFMFDGRIIEELPAREFSTNCKNSKTQEFVKVVAGIH